MAGIRWRDFSFAELIWVAHTTTSQRLQEDKSPRVRMYLTQTKDYTALREWDKSQLTDSSDK